MTLQDQHCRALKKGDPALPLDEGETLRGQLQPEWEIDPAVPCLQRTFRFKNYHQTLAFVNAVAWIAHQQDHHPDMEVSYNRCVVRYTTHAVGGLSENDFICAAKVDALNAAAVQ